MVYVIGIVAALIILFGFLCYKKAPPTEAIVVTGFGLSKPKVVCGKGTFVLPVLQRADRLNMRLLKIVLTCSGKVISYNCQSKDEALGTVVGLYGGRRF